MPKTISIIAIMLLILVGIGTAVYLTTKNITPKNEVTEKLEPKTPPTTSPVAYQWKFSDQEADSSGNPGTQVAIIKNGTEKVVGTFVGSCHEVKTGETGVLSEPADTNEVTRAQCWFAGGGNEIGVFTEAGKTVVKIGELSEGSAEEPGFRGNFKTVFEL